VTVRWIGALPVHPFGFSSANREPKMGYMSVDINIAVASRAVITHLFVDSFYLEVKNRQRRWTMRGDI
jgi:hypothetical protein